MTARFSRSAEQVKCDLAGDPHSRVRAAKAAMQRLTWGRTGRIADATGLSQRTVETWGNPADPQRSPLQQLELAIFAAVESGAYQDEAAAPLAYLADLLGYDLAPRLKVLGFVGIPSAAATALRESSEGIAKAVASLRDGGVSQREADEIEREVAESITSLHRLAREAQAAVSTKRSA